MRHISYALTAPQIEAGTKTVTRRLKTTWQPGERRLAIEKGRGIPKGGHVRYLRDPATGNRIVHECVSVRSERLWKLLHDPIYGAQEVRNEGFPEMTPLEFVEFYCKHAKCKNTQTIQRIEFKAVNEYTGETIP